MKVKLKVVLVFVALVSISSCVTYYGKRTYKETYNLPRSTEGIKCDGYYSISDSSYVYWNYKRTESGEIIAQDRMKRVHYKFIILYENGDAYVNIQTRYDGLHHYPFDDVPPTGVNSKETAHAQFLKEADRLGLFEEERNWKYPGFYEISKDSISITFFRVIADGNRRLAKLSGVVVNDSTFQIYQEKIYSVYRLFDRSEVVSREWTFEYDKRPNGLSND